MSSARSTAAHASVVFLKIPELSQNSVTEQVRLKGQLEGAISAGLARLDAGERIVLEAPDGAAIVVLGNPAAALALARASSIPGDGFHVEAGINHGPVRIAPGGTTPIVLGDGIAAAQAVAGFAPRNRIAATREFRDALARASPGLARHLVPAGIRTDAADRAYDVFFADELSVAARRRRFVLALAASCAAILGSGVAARVLLRGHLQPAVVAPTTRVAPAAPPAPAALATLRLDIRPQGEIFIDGVAKGRSPPITSMQIVPGKHTIEIRHARATPLVLQLEAGPGEALSIRHSFAPPAPKSAWRKFFDQFK